MALQKSGTRSTTAERRQRGGLGSGKGEEAASRRRGKEWVSIGDGETAILRVFPGTFEEVFVHRTPIEIEQGEGKKKKVTTKHYDVACLDQEEVGVPCPGCADDLERRYKFYVWVIVRGNPDALEAHEKKDRLALWSGGVKLFKALNKKHKSKGLENRDIEVSREGTRFETEYEVEWADEENVSLTAADKKLADKIESLDFYTTPPEFDEFYEPPSERSKDDDDEDVGARSQRRGSPFSGDKKTISSTKASSKSGATGLAKLRAKSSGGEEKPGKKIIKKKR